MEREHDLGFSAKWVGAVFICIAAGTQVGVS
jgi:hypothetical protein